MNALLPIVTLLLAAGCAALAVWAMAERARAERALLEARMLREQAAAGAESLKAQAAMSANAVAEELVKRATETFAAQDRLVQAKLEAQLKPVADTLEKFQLQVTATEKARAEEAGGLKSQIAQLLLASTATQEEARKLSAALRRGAGVQGRWGEQMLRNVLEMAGLKAKVDFDEQVTLDSAQRPDVVVRLPGGGSFVIDAKCSLNAFLEAQDALDDAAREAGYLRHAQSVRGHMQSLASKAYWEQLDASPDFVVMFVPGDAFLAAAVERLPDLYAQGMDRRVILVTPSSLFALCKAVVYGWRVEEQNLNAKEIVSLGRELYKRIATMAAHAQAMGRGLETAVGRYNQFVGSLETQVHTQARRFEDLKVDHEGKEIPELTPIETAVRPLTKLAPVLTLVEAAPTSAP
ncbi:MAG TPA: DNA recombination protein RmuC [Caulobacteraceae bacterium]|nr:DNA recombination protein RmuC [Caulobacteraceae bacterium]